MAISVSQRSGRNESERSAHDPVFDLAGTDFKFAQQTAQYGGNDNRGYQQQAQMSYGSKSKLKPTKPASDLFASTEADFFGAPKKCESG